jgi:diaminopimelate epimerase
MKIEFYKYEGTGNDFIIIDNRDKKLKANNVALWKKLCDRHFGIGADGLMLIQEKKGYDFEMVYFNADGNESSMCGNGGRCITHLAKKLGIVKGKSAGFIAIDGKHEAVFVDKDVVKLKMNDVKSISDHSSYYVLNTGSPHYVTMVKNAMRIPVNIDGKTIRNREPFKKEGINVNFVEVSSGNPPLLRTYERGVEDETLSCGTGTVAAALVLASKGLATAKDHCDIQTRGGMLKVWFTPNKAGFKDIWLEGPATFVFKGSLKV